MQYGDIICGDPIRITLYLDLIRSLQVGSDRGSIECGSQRSDLISADCRDPCGSQQISTLCEDQL